MLISFDYLFKKYKITPAGVVHLGANTGQEAETYDKFGIKDVIWIEAHLPTFLALLRHLKDFPAQRAINACVSDKDGDVVTFNVASNGAQSSSFLEFGTHEVEHPTVRYVSSIEMTTVRLDTLFARNEIVIGKGWFLNIDLQGAELLALKGMGDLLEHFDHAYIEVNEKELYKGCPMTKDIDCHLGLRGFVGQEKKMTGNGWGDKYYRRS